MSHGQTDIQDKFSILRQYVHKHRVTNLVRKQSHDEVRINKLMQYTAYKIHMQYMCSYLIL